MPSANDPVLRWLRDLIQGRGLNTAELALKSGLDRGRLRKVLAGTEPMLVDELMSVSSALELSPADMGLPQLEGADIPLVLPEELPAAPPAVAGVDPYGDHARQLFEVAFALGCTFYFASEVAQLASSGVPAAILDGHVDRGELMISLDAAHHRDNDPRFHDDGITLTLSFDALYDCTFPWPSIRRVVFDVEPDDEGADDDTSNRPHLRLVT